MRSPKVMRAGTGNKNFFIWPAVHITCVYLYLFLISKLFTKCESFEMFIMLIN